MKRKRLQTSAKNRVVFKLEPTPFNLFTADNSKVLMLYRYLVQEGFGQEVTTEFELAEFLGIHRAFAYEWYEGLNRCQFILRSCMFRFGEYLNTFKIRPPYDFEQKWLNENIVELDIVPCDPWVDIDILCKYKFHDWWFPYFIDEVVDKYYNVFMDEYLIFYGKRRVRDNGKIFVPLVNKRHSHDHPIYFQEEALKQGSKRIERPQTPPPPERRRDISKRCSGGKPGIVKRGSSQAPRYFRSWADKETLSRLQLYWNKKETE